MKLHKCLAPSFAALTLIGCGDFATKSKPSSTVPITSETKDVAPAIPVAEPQYKFDGTQVASLNDINGAENFRVRLVLQTAKDFSYSREFTNTSPPMPFKSTSFSAYLIDDTYSVRISPENSDQTQYTLGDIYGRNEIVYEKSCGIATLNFNGETVFNGPVEKPLGVMYLGKGFKDRYWSGSYEIVETEVLNPVCPK